MPQPSYHFVKTTPNSFQHNQKSTTYEFCGEIDNRSSYCLILRLISGMYSCTAEGQCGKSEGTFNLNACQCTYSFSATAGTYAQGVP